jgi:hypothetical protein
MANGKNAKSEIKEKPKKEKRQLTQQQEFEIMKLVLDKFLWLGLAVMLYGLYTLATGYMDNLFSGLGYIIVGAVVLAIFVFIQKEGKP